MYRALTSVAVVACIVPVLLSPLTVMQGTAQRRGTVTTTVTVIQRGEWQRQVFAARDAVFVRMTETCRYEIISWNDEDVTLERPFCDATVTAEGGGETSYPPPVTKNEKWTYFADPKPTSPLTDLSLDLKTGEGLLEIRGGSIRARSAEGVESDAAGPAALVIGLLMSAAAGVKPEGAEFSGGQTVYEVQRFKFSPTARQFSGGNQGAWSLSYTEGDGATGNASASISYSVSWGQPESELEVAVEPSADYTTWVPAGNLRYPLNPKEELPPGEELRIKVTVRQKGDPRSRGKAKLRFGFRDVSREEGVCLNWPPAGADTKPDLRLRFTDRALGSPSADGTSIATDDLVEEATLVVDAYDFGAWGTLRISATDKDQRDVVVKIQGRQTPDLAIPLDEDANQIADAWKPALTKDRAGDADDEHQDGNEHDGDGLTLYEEYRGFVENRSHRQGDPEKKDFFVLNRVGKTAEPGVRAFADASQLQVHAQLTDEEMDWDSGRVINKYSSSGFEQHGVVLTLHATPADDTGYSKAVGGPGPPGTVEMILISAKNRARPAAVPGTDFTDADLEVAHELMHAVNVWHHGEEDWDNVSWIAGTSGEMLEIREDGRSYVRAFLDSAKNGAEVTADRIAGRTVWLGRQRGQHSGAQCLMRYAYNGILAYQDLTAPDSRRFVYDGPREFGVKLCRSGAGTGVNDKDRLPQPAWGRAAEGRGNCFGQIMVKDRAQSGR